MLTRCVLSRCGDSPRRARGAAGVIAGVLRGGAGRDGPRSARDVPLRRRAASTHEARAGRPRVPAPRRGLPPRLAADGLRPPPRKLLVHAVGLAAARGDRDRPSRRAGYLVSSDYHTRVVGKHWEGARQISIGRRSRPTSTCSPTPTSSCGTGCRARTARRAARYDQVVGTGLRHHRHVRVLPHDHRPGRALDVFLATDADSGALLEFAIPSGRTRRRTPAGCWRRAAGGDIRASGADGVVHEPEERALVRRRSSRSTSTGAVLLWTDRRRDGRRRASDIAEWGVLKPFWKPMPYSD